MNELKDKSDSCEHCPDHKRMKELRFILANDIRGLEIEESTDYHGYFLVGPDGWTQYTVYVGEHGYSAYIATPDIWTGLDIADEKLLVEKVSAQACVSAVHSHHASYAPELYAVAPAVGSVTDYQQWQKEMKRQAALDPTHFFNDKGPLQNMKNPGDGEYNFFDE